MKQKIFLWLGATAGVMLLLPWLGVAFCPADAGMPLVLVLLFGIDPVYCIAAGRYAGKQVRTFWWLPGVCACLFLLGAWLFFEVGEPAFWTYAGIYFALGMESMLVTRLIVGRREENG